MLLVLDFKSKLNWSTESRPFPSVKIYKNLSSANHIPACGQTERQTDRHDELTVKFQICFLNVAQDI